MAKKYLGTIRLKNWILILYFILLICDLHSAPKTEPTEKEGRKWDVLLYGGHYTQTDLLPIVLRQKTDYKESYIATAGISSPTGYHIRFIDFETEVNLTKHFGIMKHWELNGMYVARISNIFSSPIGIALGEGLSLASENPKLENQAKGINLNNLTIQFKDIESRNLLNFAMVELEYRFPFSYDPRLFLRVHHRSGVFGLLCPPDPACGSNFISYGVKFSL